MEDPWDTKAILRHMAQHSVMKERAAKLKSHTWVDDKTMPGLEPVHHTAADMRKIALEARETIKDMEEMMEKIYDAASNGDMRLWVDYSEEHRSRQDRLCDRLSLIGFVILQHESQFCISWE